MFTRNGICYDLKISPYIYKDKNLTYHFSSKLHLEKFMEKKIENRVTVNQSLTKRFGYEVVVPELADVVLYRKIETRGFYVVDNEGQTICKNNLIYVGGKVTKRN